MTREEFLERKEQKRKLLNDFAFRQTLRANDHNYTATLNLFGRALFSFIDYGDISEPYIRNSLSFLLSNGIISIEDYEKFDTIIRQAVQLHETDYCD